MRHSERSSFNSCPYRYSLEKTGLRPITLTPNAEDRTFGQAIHAALKAHYDGKEWEDIIKEYAAIYPIQKEYKSEAKIYTGGLKLLASYRTYWADQDSRWDILGTEIAGSMEFNDDEHELHIDLLARNKQTEEVWAWDHKCTEKQLGKGFWKKYELDSQVTRYTQYVREKYGACGGFIINGMQVGHRQKMYRGEPAGYYQNFDRQPFSRSKQQIDFWMRSELEWADLIRHCEASGMWPKHLSSLCGWCDFYELCMSAGSEAVKETLYTTEILDLAIDQPRVIDET